MLISKIAAVLAGDVLAVGWPHQSHRIAGLHHQYGRGDRGAFRLGDDAALRGMAALSFLARPGGAADRGRMGDARVGGAGLRGAPGVLRVNPAGRASPGWSPRSLLGPLPQDFFQPICLIGIELNYTP